MSILKKVQEVLGQEEDREEVEKTEDLPKTRRFRKKKVSP